MTTSLPFELSTDSVSDWLQSLSQLNSVNSANQLNKIVKQLRGTKTEPQPLMQTLIQLTPTVLYITADIELSGLVERDKDSDKQSLKIEKLCIQLLRNMSLAFCRCSEDKSLTMTEKAQGMYYALQFIAQTQRLSVLFYQMPSSTLWKKTAKIYQVASDENILDNEMQNKVKEFKQQLSIKAVIQRNCLFALFRPNSFTTQQIKQLFIIADKYANLLTFDQNGATDCLFSWNLMNGQAPSEEEKNYHSSESKVNMEISDFLELIQTKAFSSTLDEALSNALITQLSGYKKQVNASLPSAFVISHLLTGMEAITEYMEKVEKLNKIRQFSVQLADNKPANNLTLEPMEFEKSHLNTKPDINSLNQQEIVPEHAKPVKILQTEDEQFFIAETPALECEIGELTLLCPKKSPLELGIIRQIKTTNYSNTTHILIEKIVGRPSFFHIAEPIISKNKAVLVSNEQSLDLFVAPCKIPKGMALLSVLEKEYIVGKLTDYSPSFMHFSVR